MQAVRTDWRLATTTQSIEVPMLLPQAVKLTAPTWTIFLIEVVEIKAIKVGAVERTRTSTVLPAATSRQCVYQFRHDRMGRRTKRPAKTACCNKWRLAGQGPKGPLPGKSGEDFA
jgi:hypothetical protein